MMLDRALIMRRSIVQMIAACEADPDRDKRVPQADQLSEEDWRVLTEVHYILQPFYCMTKHLEGRAPNAINGAIWEALPSIEYLLSHMEMLVNHYEAPNCPPFNPALANTTLSAASRQHLQECVNNSWAKLTSYYEKTDLSPVYAAAVWLHPAQGWNYIDDKWRDKREWIRDTKRKVEDFYQDEWKDRHPNQADEVGRANKKTSHLLLLLLLLTDLRTRTSYSFDQTLPPLVAELGRLFSTNTKNTIS